MFFELVSRNSKRSRKENGLFFASLLVCIVAFYIILSLSYQDIMIFLADMESDAVNRLMGMIPLFYEMTLFILFFLIYFASKFQLERRRHEFGVYLLMGMRRFKLFLMLIAEDMRSSMIALLIGLPVAIFLSEIISLVTARLVGLGIIGHQLSISMKAILWTAVGFLLMKLIAFLILSGKIARHEIGSLLVETPEGAKKSLPAIIHVIAFIIGIAFLVIAYGIAIKGMAWREIWKMGIALILGLAGTMLLFFGLRCVMGFMVGYDRKKQKLQAFTFRQLQENVIHRSNTLAISSLLILAALCCLGTGVAIAQFFGTSEKHVLDYTFNGDNTEPDIVRKKLNDKGLASVFSNLFEMKVGYIRAVDDHDNAFHMDAIIEQLKEQPESSDRDSLLNNLSYGTYPHLISQTSYNMLLDIAGLPSVELADNEAAVYIDTEFTSTGQSEILNRILSSKPEVQIAKENYHLTGTVQSTSLVTDRSITLSFALIVPDAVLEQFTDGDYSVYLNGILNPDEVENKSLLTAISEANHKLDAAGLTYESYLQNMARQIFYVVAASYITIYLAIIFLIIANTVIGVQFLSQQQKTGRRYQTLARLGASYDTICYSAWKQIKWYYGIPIVVAAFSSIFGVQVLFNGLLSQSKQNHFTTLMLISMTMMMLLCVVEYVYMLAVKKSSNRYILKLMIPEREE